MSYAEAAKTCGICVINLVTGSEVVRGAAKTLEFVHLMAVICKESLRWRKWWIVMTREAHPQVSCCCVQTASVTAQDWIFSVLKSTVWCDHFSMG
jgi:hypothetical protein